MNSRRILAFDTTADTGSIALLDGEELLEELLVRSEDGFAHYLFQHIELLLHRHGWTLSGVDCFVSAAGPGSFTGVRVGLTAAKGLAETLGKPVLAVSNLQAIASFGTAPLRASLIDARRGEIYGAVYDAAGEVVRPETVTLFPAWLASLPPVVEFVSPTRDPFLPMLRGTPFENSVFTEAPRTLAAAMGRIARRRLLAGEAGDPVAIDANYVRRSDAELLFGKPAF